MSSISGLCISIVDDKKVENIQDAMQQQQYFTKSGQTLYSRFLSCSFCPVYITSPLQSC